jgi:hypothetical protein
VRKLHRIGLAAAAVAASAALTACGSSSVTLHGTYTDVESFTGPVPSTCQEWENADNLSGNASSWQVIATADNVPAGNAVIQWTGKPVPNAGDVQMICTGSWSVTVPAARAGYSLSATGTSGSVTVPVSDAGKPIALDSTGGVNFPGS